MTGRKERCLAASAVSDVCGIHFTRRYSWPTGSTASAAAIAVPPSSISWRQKSGRELTGPEALIARPVHLSTRPRSLRTREGPRRIVGSATHRSSPFRHPPSEAAACRREWSSARDGVELNRGYVHQDLGVLEVIRYRPRSLQGQDNGLPNQRSVAVSSAVPGDIGKRRASLTSP